MVIIDNRPNPIFHVRESLNNIYSDFDRALKKLAAKINKIFSGMLDLLITIFTLPTRYWPRKTVSLAGLVAHCITVPLQKWGVMKSPLPASGYQTSFMKELNPEEAKPFVRYAALGAILHNTNKDKESKWMKPFGLKIKNPQELSLDLPSLPQSIEIRDSCILGTDPAFKIAILENENCKEVIIGFGAVGSIAEELEDDTKKGRVTTAQKWQIFCNLIGMVPSVFPLMTRLTRSILRNYEGWNVKFAGQCLGGAFAQSVAFDLSNERTIPTFCFNSIPIGPGIQDRIGTLRLSRAESFITHISTKRDYISDNQLLGGADTIVSRLGLGTPGNFGKRYSIPTAFKDTFRTHAFVFSSIIWWVLTNGDLKQKKMRWVEPKALAPDEQMGIIHSANV